MHRLSYRVIDLGRDFSRDLSRNSRRGSRASRDSSYFLSAAWIGFFGISMGLSFFPHQARAASDEAGEVNLEQRTVPYNELQMDLPERSPFGLNYFGIFYGPSVGNPTSYQPDLAGHPDIDRPLVMKNFVTASYSLSDEVALAGTGFWSWQPVLRQSLQLEDPFVRVSYNSLLRIDQFNLYGDLRVHFPVSTYSRQIDQKLGIQTFQALTYEMGKSHLTFGTYVSERVNFYGSRGYGNDLDLYLAPNVNYQFSQNLSVSILYEMYAGHFLRRSVSSINNEGTDLEPGLIWDVTPRIMVNPYLNLLTGGKISINSTSIGFMLSVSML